jgi:hypothetical protein
MGYGVPNVIHKYDVADFTKYYYWQAFFGGAGTWVIDGNPFIATAGLRVDLKISTKPVNSAGSTEMYLLGDIMPYLGPDTYTGSTSNNYPVATPYYYGNLGMGGPETERVFN